MVKQIRSLKDVDVTNKTVLLRANLDAPLINGEVEDDTLIKASIPTIEHLIKNNAKVIILAHLGNPRGEYTDELSMMMVRFELGRLLGKPIKFVNIKNCENSIKFMEFGDVLLLENLKFNTEEDSTNEEERVAFVSKLASMADLYVYDDFATTEKLASTFDLPRMINTVAGLQIENELQKLEEFNNQIKSPFTVIIGGNISSEKISFIENSINSFDNLLLGGEIAYLFLVAEGIKVDNLDFKKEDINKAKEIIKQIKKARKNLVLPSDHIVINTDKQTSIVQNNGSIPTNMSGVDIGPNTIENFKVVIKNSKTIFWYGPLGKYEQEEFGKGTQEIAEYITFETPKETYKLAAGDSTLVAINKLKIKSKRFNHVSVGGNSTLAYLQGKINSNFEILS